MNNIQHIFFDLDHTLWDFEKNSKETLASLFAAHCMHQPNACFNDFFSTYSKHNEEAWRAYALGQISQAQLRETRFSKTYNSLKWQLDGSMQSLAENYVQLCPLKTHLHEGAMQILEYLKPKYKLHILSNGFKEVQATKLRSSGIQDFFLQVISSEDSGYQKPNKMMYYYALDKCGARLDNTLMIGDNFMADIEGAENAGLPAIWFNPLNKQGNRKAKMEVNSLLGLKNFL